MSFFGGKPSTQLCDFCNEKKATVFCQKCKKGKYCSEECLEKDRSLHKYFCNPGGRLVIPYKNNKYLKSRVSILFSKSITFSKESIYALVTENEKSITEMLTVFFKRGVSQFFLTNQVFNNLINNLYDHIGNWTLLILTYLKTGDKENANNLFIFFINKYDSYFDLIIEDIIKKFKNAKNSTVLFKTATHASTVMIKIFSVLISLCKKFNKSVPLCKLIEKYCKVFEGLAKYFVKKEYILENVSFLSLLAYYLCNNYYPLGIPIKCYNNVISFVGAKTEEHPKALACLLRAAYNKIVINYVRGRIYESLGIIQVFNAKYSSLEPNLRVAYKRFQVEITKIHIEILYDNKSYEDAFDILCKVGEFEDLLTVKDKKYLCFFLSQILKELNMENAFLGVDDHIFKKLSGKSLKNQYVDIIDTMGQMEQSEFALVRKKDTNIKLYENAVLEIDEINKFFIFMTMLSEYQIKLLNDTQPNLTDIRLLKNLPIFFSNQFMDSLSYGQRIYLYNLNSLSFIRYAVLNDSLKPISFENLNYTLMNLKERALVSLATTGKSSEEQKRTKGEEEYEEEFFDFLKKVPYTEAAFVEKNKGIIYKVYSKLTPDEAKEIESRPEIIINIVKNYVSAIERRNKRINEKYQNKNKEHIDAIKRIVTLKKKSTKRLQKLSSVLSLGTLNDELGEDNGVSDLEFDTITDDKSNFYGYEVQDSME